MHPGQKTERTHTPRGACAALTCRTPTKRTPRCKQFSADRSDRLRTRRHSRGTSTAGIHAQHSTERHARARAQRCLMVGFFHFRMTRSIARQEASLCTAAEPPWHSLVHPYFTLLPGGLGCGRLGSAFEAPSSSVDKSMRQCCNASPHVWESPAQREGTRAGCGWAL